MTWAWKRFAASSDGQALSPGDQALSSMRRWIAECWDVTIKGTPSAAAVNHAEGRTNNREAVGWYNADTVYLLVPWARDAAGGAVGDYQQDGAMQGIALLASRPHRGWLDGSRLSVMIEEESSIS